MIALRQRGTTTVEFAIIGLVFFMVMFGVMEMGRLLYTFSVLSEGTRRAARIAAVCPVDDPSIAAAVGFAGEQGFDSSNVSVAYLDQTSAPIASPTSAVGFASIRFVRVQITGYVHQMIIPLIPASVTVPPFTATLPSESLGIVAGVSTPC